MGELYIKGRISRAWSQAQEDYYLMFPLRRPSPYFNGASWAVKSVEGTFSLIKSIWNARTERFHGDIKTANIIYSKI